MFKNTHIRILCIYAKKSVRCPPLKDIPLEYKVKLDLQLRQSEFSRSPVSGYIL